MEEREQAWMRYWLSTDEPPACDDGLALLMPFAMQSPTLYEVAERYGFTDLTFHGFATNPLWLAFAAHRSGCDKCNEV